MKRNPRKDLADIADALVQLNVTEAEQTIELLTLHLRRAIQCPELDTLTSPTLMLDAIRSQVRGRTREARDGRYPSYPRGYRRTGIPLGPTYSRKTGRGTYPLSCLGHSHGRAR